MQCRAYCLGDSFNMTKLGELLQQDDCLVQKFDNENVIHIAFDFDKLITTLDEVSINPAELSLERTDIFYFKFGCIVIYESKDSEHESKLRKFLDNTLNSILINPNTSQINLNSIDNLRDLDYLNYKVDVNTGKDYIDINNNEVIVKQNLLPTKLSIAYAMAQSVKLDSLEKSCNHLITKTMPMQRELASKGMVSLSRHSIIKSMGELFAQKYLTNLYSETLETPEFFWRKGSKYEDLYLMVSSFQELNKRKNIINKKLDIIQELYGVLSTELNHNSSSRLEIIIIVLIAIEVLIGLFSHADIKALFL